MGSLPATPAPPRFNGHIHVFVDREPPPVGEVIAREDGIIHTKDTVVTVTGLSVGRHRLAVVASDASYRRLDRALLWADVMVEEPSITASTPMFVRNGEPVPVELNLDGVPLTGDPHEVPPAWGGHIHVSVDGHGGRLPDR